MVRKVLLSLLACLLASCGTSSAPDLVLGIGVTRVHGEVADAEVLGVAKSMEDCRQLAKKGYAEVPPTHTPDLDVQIACAAVELQ